MTIADSQLATTLAGPLMHLIGQQQQQQLPSVIRWFTTCTRHPALAPFVGRQGKNHCMSCLAKTGVRLVMTGTMPLPTCKMSC